jgi:hypothetical protein
LAILAGQPGVVPSKIMDKSLAKSLSASMPGTTLYTILKKILIFARSPAGSYEYLQERLSEIITDKENVENKNLNGSKQNGVFCFAL